jgi:hypothetical protein
MSAVFRMSCSRGEGLGGGFLSNETSSTLRGCLPKEGLWHDVCAIMHELQLEPAPMKPISTFTVILSSITSACL